MHLVQDPTECVAAFGPYHASICLASNKDVQALRVSFAGPRRQIPVHDILNEGFLEIGECAITQDETFSRLHSHQCPWYGNRLVCISA